MIFHDASRITDRKLKMPGDAILWFSTPAAVLIENAKK